MKKLFSVFILLSVSIVLIVSCGVYHQNSKKEKERKTEMEIQTKNLIEILDEFSFDRSKFLNLENTIIEDLSNQESVSIVFLGDSTTEQNQYTNGDPGHVNIIKNKLKEIYGDKITVINEGVSGDNSSDMLKRIGESVIEKNPDYVIISSGINDLVSDELISDFHSNMEKIIQITHAETEAIIILRTSNPTLGKDLNMILHNQINADLEKLAKEHRVGFINTFGLISLDKQNSKYDYREHMTDIYHPNGKGQEVIANTILYGLLLTKYK